MPDETRTETTRSDAPSADDSLFGDAADNTAAAVVEEQDAEEQDGPPEEMKVVVSIKGGRATIGVQRPSADPHIESFDDPDLSGLTQEALAVVERARAKWEDDPRHPAHVRPAPRPGVGLGAGRGRHRQGPPGKRQPSSNPRR